MTRRRKAAIKGSPLTAREATGIDYTSYDKMFSRGKPIVCSRCGVAGGTLKHDKVTGEYYHADEATCKLMRMRQKVKR